MITALTRLTMTGLLIAAATVGAAAQTHKADVATATTAGAANSAKARPPAAVPAGAAKTDAAAAAATPTGNPEPIPLELPKPGIGPTPKNVPPGTRIKTTNGPGKPRDPFLAPRGVKNVAFKRPVTASDNEPVIGELRMITDGGKEANQDSFVELGPGVQWVQIDLGSAVTIHAIVVWHEHSEPIVYQDVVIQVSDDKDFIENVRTLFNNDHDNSAGLGIGEDWGYFETNEGLLVDAKAVRARYVRLYSNGNTGNDLNRYTEVEVHALPAGTTQPATAPKTIPAEANPRATAPTPAGKS